MKKKKDCAFSLMFSSSSWLVHNMQSSHGCFLFLCLRQNWMPANLTCTPPYEAPFARLLLVTKSHRHFSVHIFLEKIVTSLLKTIVSPLFLGWSSDFLMWPPLTPLMPGDFSLMTLLHSLWRSQTIDLLSVFWMYRGISYLQDLLFPLSYFLYPFAGKLLIL